MSERKVLNKYYPPDFDVTKLPKLRLSRDRQFVIRIMAPFSMRCKTCGDYIYKGRKFNARQETVQGETYLGLRIFRFYIRCPKCLSEITFKTDPENTDYTMEEGATRNFEAFRLAKKQEENFKKEKEEEELNNPMKALENRTMESRGEMQMIEKLEELKDLNTRHAAVDHEKLIRDHILIDEEKLISKQEEADEALVKSLFSSSNDGYVKRIDDFEVENENDEVAQEKPGPSRKRTATDHLTEAESPSGQKKKTPIQGGVVGFSKMKLASLVRIKKTDEDKKSSDIIDSKISTAGQTIEESKQPKCLDKSATTSASSIRTVEADQKQINSLSLLGNYNSSSNSDDSE